MRLELSHREQKELKHWNTHMCVLDCFYAINPAQKRGLSIPLHWKKLVSFWFKLVWQGLAGWTPGSCLLVLTWHIKEARKTLAVSDSSMMHLWKVTDSKPQSQAPAARGCRRLWRTTLWDLLTFKKLSNFFPFFSFTCLNVALWMADIRKGTENWGH